MKTITLVEQHIIRCTDPRFAELDAAAFKSKNLYNAANDVVRQAYIFAQRFIPFAKLYHVLNHHDAYKDLPRKVSNL